MRFSSGVYADGTPAPRDGSVEEGLRLLEKAPAIAGHNIIRFDIPAVQKLYPWFSPSGEIVDTLVDSRLIWTDLMDRDSKAMKRRQRPPEFTGKYVGQHSLKAWGYRLGTQKGDYAEIKEEEARALGLSPAETHQHVWGSFNREMDEYCKLDVVVTLSLLEKIEEKDYSPAARRLEVEVTKIVALQEQHGFAFDMPAAEKLLATLSGRRAELSDQLAIAFPPWWAPLREKGENKVLTPKADNRRHGYVKDCPVTKCELVVFNPGSRDEIADRMTKLFGWSPVEFTDGGKPKVDETTLTGLNYPEAKLLVEYLTVEKRLGQLAEGKQAWIKAVQEDGRIHGRVNPMGAGSHRGSHSGPNMAQVPAEKSPYGHECRSLFCVAVGRRLVGTDAEGLQLRILGHYMARFDGGAFANAVANGDKKLGTDAHTLNQKIIKLSLRDSAKTYIYAYLLGAGNWKLGAIIYDDFTDAQRGAFNAKYAEGNDREEAFARLGLRSKRLIEEGLPALAAVQKLMKEKAKRGYILSLDGRVVRVPSLHVALAFALQAGEAVVMKRAMVLLYRRAHERGWVWGKHWAQVAWVHDEFQCEVYDPTIVEDFKRMAADCIRDAGLELNLQCPLAGESKDGANWGETH